MRAVADAGPIIHLSWIDRLDLLERLFEEVFLPPAVRDEILAPPAGTLGLDAIQNGLAQGLLLVRVPTKAAVPSLSGSRPLGAGEMEALVLTEQIGADILLTDDADAAAVARRTGFRATGTVGLLVLARQDGLIPAALPLVLRLREHGQWIGERLMNEIRQQEADQG